MTKRRVYKNPPITEALCEFRFQGDQPWDWTLPGLFYSKTKEEYPEKQQKNLLEFSMEAQGSNVGTKVKGGVARMQFFSSDRSRLIGIGPDVLSAHVMRPYPGWEVFQEIIRRSYQTYLEISSPIGVNRIGLRYINKIEIPEPRVDLSDYFVSPPSVPDSLPQSMKTFLSRIEVIYDETTVLVQTMSSSKATRDDHSCIILDLDAVYASHEQALALDEVEELVQRLRTLERDAFEAMITDNARNLFDE